MSVGSLPPSHEVHIPSLESRRSQFVWVRYAEVLGVSSSVVLVGVRKPSSPRGRPVTNLRSVWCLARLPKVSPLTDWLEVEGEQGSGPGLSDQRKLIAGSPSDRRTPCRGAGAVI